MTICPYCQSSEIHPIHSSVIGGTLTACRSCGREQPDSYTPDLEAVDRKLAEQPIDPLRLAIARESLQNLTPLEWSSTAQELAGYAVALADALLAELRKGGR